MKRTHFRPRVAVPALGAALIALLTAACSSSGSSSGSAPADTKAGSAAAQQVTIGSTDTFRFDPPTVRVRVGAVRVTLTDSGSYPHNLKVDSLGFTSSTVSGNLGEQSTTFTLNFTHAGTYGFVCTFHDTAGMKGQFVVS